MAETTNQLEHKKLRARYHELEDSLKTAPAEQQAEIRAEMKRVLELSGISYPQPGLGCGMACCCW